MFIQLKTTHNTQKQGVELGQEAAKEPLGHLVEQLHKNFLNHAVGMFNLLIKA